MTDHDVLMSKLIQVQNLLHFYVEEYAPEGGAETIHLIDHAVLLVHDMPYAETKKVS